MEVNGERMAENNNTLTETQLVVFDLAKEYYGVDIGDVREIIRMQAITRVPGAPEFVEGVINLRGRVVPVVDLRKRLELIVGEQTKESRIVVVDINGRDVGVIVDAVTEVLRIPMNLIEPPSSMVTNADSDYLRGIAKLETKLVILLDLDKVLSAIESENIIAMQQTGGAEEESPKGKKKVAAAAR
jgi:purine-binding chemotaxis protein CheW